MFGNNKNKDNNALEYISLQDATMFCIYSQEYLSLRARQGKLKSVKLGRNWVTTKEWLAEYANKVEEYNNSINNNGHKKPAFEPTEKIVRGEIVKDQIIHYPPENLPIVRYPKIRFNLGTLRPGFATALILVLITAGGVFGKESLLKTYNDAVRTAEKIVQNVEIVSDDVFTATVNYKGTLVSVPGILSDYGQWVKNSYSVANGKTEQKIGNALLSLTPEEINQWVVKTYRDISRGYSTANELVEKKVSDFISFRITLPRITMPKITTPDIDIGGKISDGRKIISNNYFAVNEKVEQEIGKTLLSLAPLYSSLDRSIEQKLFSFAEDLISGYVFVGNYVEQEISQKLAEFKRGMKDLVTGFKSETIELVRSVEEPFVKIYQSVARAYRFVISPWKDVVTVATKEEPGEEVIVKRVEVSKVVEPVKEVTRETVQQITKIDDAALAEVRANMVYLETEIGKRLYAPGGVVSQTIYVTEPVSSPKIYQENGEIVLQTLGSGNVILTAATGLQLYGQQVVIESTSLLNPLVFIDSPTRINGAVTVAGDINAGDIHAADISGTTITGSTLTLSGAISATGATSTLAGLEATGFKMVTGANNNYVLTSDASGYATWQAATGGGGGTNTWDWIVSGTTMYSSTTVSTVGISTTTPRYALDVWGDLAIGTSTDTNTPILYVDSGQGGRVGIGTTTLAGLFTVGTTTQALFVDAAGKLGINGVTYSWPSSQGGASTVLTNDSNGILTWTAAAGGTNTWDWIVSGTTMYSSTTVSTVGISTTTPRYALDVWGDLAIGTSTDTNTPILYVDSGQGGRVGIGTTTLAGLLTVGTTTPALVVSPNGNVLLAQSTGAVAIGTATPSSGYDLTVWGNVLGDGNFYSNQTGSGGGFIVRTGGSHTWKFYDYGGGQGAIETNSASNYNFNIENIGTGIVNLIVDGSIGVATTSPRHKLDVWGDIGFGTSTAGKYGDNNGTTTPALYVDSGEGGRVGIGTTTLAGLFTVGTTTQALFVDGAGKLGINGVTYSWPSSQGGANTYLKNDSNGNLTWETVSASGGSNTWDWIVSGTTMYSSTTVSTVGISTTTPRYALDVWGDMAVGTSTGTNAPMNYPLLYVNSGDNGQTGVGIGTTTVSGNLLTVGTTTPALLVASSGYIGMGTAGPDRRLDILDVSNPQLRLTYTDGSIYTDLQTTALGHLYINPSGGNVGIGTSTPYSKLTINESNDFAFGDFNASTVDTMEGSHLNWHSNNKVYVSTSTESTIVKVGSQSLKIYASTTPEDVVVRKIFTTSQNFSNAMERLSFWIYADKIATSSATTTQIISIGIYSSANASNATTTKQIYIQEEDRWQYEEWNISGLANATSVDQLFFRIDVSDISTVSFYIDQIRLYNSTERSGEFFVGKDGSLTIMGRGSVEIARADGSSNLPGIKVDSAVVELGQSLSVNTGGNVGFDYDLEFLNTGLAQITSEGPLRIAAGDSNHSENLTLTTGGSGDVIVELTASSSAFMINHGWDASNTIPFIINSETYATTTLDKLGVLFQIISDVSTTDPGVSTQDENVVFSIDAFGGYYYDGTSHTSASDVAENYYVTDESIGAGDVVCLNNTPLTVAKCSQSYQNNLIGVVSTKPALLMAADLERSRAVALAGRVPVKISAENGPINIGDPLTSASSTPGAAMKATGLGKILGYALETFEGNSTSTQIIAFINLQERSGGDLTVYQNPEGKIEVQTLVNSNLATLFSIDEEGALVVGKLKADEIETKGITIYDKITSEPYCITMENGELKTTAGKCNIASAGELFSQILDNNQEDSSADVCTNGANRPCSSEVGACLIGLEICENGVWGECIGAVMPSDEICDEVDNDCDGETDEGGVCGESPTPLIGEPEPGITTSTEPIIEPDISTSTDEIATTTTP